MEKKKFHCNGCSLRKAYDNNPKSILGRIWHWHIGFCPGWRCYVASLTEEEKENMSKQYGFRIGK